MTTDRRQEDKIARVETAIGAEVDALEDARDALRYTGSIAAWNRARAALIARVADLMTDPGDGGIGDGWTVGEMKRKEWRFYSHSALFAAIDRRDAALAAATKRAEVAEDRADKVERSVKVLKQFSKSGWRRRDWWCSKAREMARVARGHRAEWSACHGILNEGQRLLHVAIHREEPPPAGHGRSMWSDTMREASSLIDHLRGEFERTAAARDVYMDDATAAEAALAEAKAEVERLRGQGSGSEDRGSDKDSDTSGGEPSKDS